MRVRQGETGSERVRQGETRVSQHTTSQTNPQKESRVLNSQLSVDGLLLHDVHDGGAGLGAALRGGVDGDGLLCRTCVLLPVDVDPGGGATEVCPLAPGGKTSAPPLHLYLFQFTPFHFSLCTANANLTVQISRAWHRQRHSYRFSPFNAFHHLNK